ncbi:MAG: hypothetical protein A2X46_16000 [Lentisphaerae bacterium GWF2_57_35]|nr:MAG: hypothetical protein A2X46_16000 [Lentisphaerae bacterium GWF2_57_35]
MKDRAFLYSLLICIRCQPSNFGFRLDRIRLSENKLMPGVGRGCGLAARGQDEKGWNIVVDEAFMNARVYQA